MLQRRFYHFIALLLSHLVHDQGKADKGIVSIEEDLELKVEIRGQGALLKSEISDALKVLINLSEHSLHLPDTLNPHLVDV